jgi:protease-4
MWSTLSDYDARSRERLNAFLDQTYEAFVAGVARGRELPESAVLKAAEGRVWTGAQAHELGLVDELGGFARALDVTREAIGVEPGRPLELRDFPPAEAAWQQALALLGGARIGLGAWASWLQWLHAPGALSAPPLLLR